jgi:hypothetical protein
MRISTRTCVASTLVFLVLGVIPVVLERDSYPHSHLPMFSLNRGEIARIDTAVGIDNHGETVRLGPRLIAATDEVIMAKDAVVNAIRSRSTLKLCAEIADRVKRSRPDIHQIHVVTNIYNTVNWFTGDKEPINVETHARCAVPL